MFMIDLQSIILSFSTQALKAVSTATCPALIQPMADSFAVMQRLRELSLMNSSA